MSQVNNPGFDRAVIEEYREKIRNSGKTYVLDTEDEQSSEYAHFYFIGNHENQEVIFDTVIYTLRLEHESEMYEIAEERAKKQFPEYAKLVANADSPGELPAALEEEVGMFLAEVILELEDEESVKVKEHVDQDLDAEFGISLDASLNREAITSTVISRFIEDFNQDKLALDETFYSFQIQDEEPENS
jgi:hypothetical protein